MESLMSASLPSIIISLRDFCCLPFTAGTGNRPKSNAPSNSALAKKSIKDIGCFQLDSSTIQSKNLPIVVVANSSYGTPNSSDAIFKSLSFGSCRNICSTSLDKFLRPRLRLSLLTLGNFFWAISKKSSDKKKSDIFFISEKYILCSRNSFIRLKSFLFLGSRTWAYLGSSSVSSKRYFALFSAVINILAITFRASTSPMVLKYNGSCVFEPWAKPSLSWIQCCISWPRVSRRSASLCMASKPIFITLWDTS